MNVEVEVEVGVNVRVNVEVGVALLLVEPGNCLKGTTPGSSSLVETSGRKNGIPGCSSGAPSR